MQIKIGGTTFPTFTEQDKALSHLSVTGSVTANKVLADNGYFRTVNMENASVCGLMTVTCLDAQGVKAPCIFDVQNITPSSTTGAITVNGELQATVLSASGEIEGAALHLTGDDGNIYALTVKVEGGEPSLVVEEVN